MVELVPRARLQLYGDGPDRPRVEALVERLGLGSRTEMAGWVPRAELERRLATAWVQAVPSRWEELIPIHFEQEISSKGHDAGHRVDVGPME